MPTLNIGGRSVSVGDEFLQLSPDQQNATVDEIAKSLMGSTRKPDKYQQAAIDETKALEDRGISTGAGYTRRLAHGATLGADTTVVAALTTPLEMIKRGTFNPAEGYSYSKAREDKIMSDSREKTGILGTAAEALGGAVSAGGLANAGVTAGRFLAPEASIWARAGAGAADNAAIGGFSGAMEGNGLEERAINAAKGGAVGGVLGGALPLAGRAAGIVASPITSQISARMNPQAYAEAQIARAISEGRTNPNQISLDLLQAANEGQPMYAVVDALGHPGQRMLSTVARSPGEGRTAVVDAMEARQAGQGRRVANALSEGFEAPQTAAQTRQGMTAARDARADAEYGAVRNNGAQVDVVPTINNIDRNIGTAGGQNLQAPNDTIEGALRPFRERLARVNPNDFEAVQRIRSDMADAAQSARQGGYGNRARLIGQAVRELDTSMEGASPGYRQANANFRQSSQDIEAVDAGRQAAMRGRPEDTIPSFQRQSQAGQRAFRAGYVDPLIESAQSAAAGANKARPLTNDAFQTEAAAMAPGNPMMQRRVAREQTMFETRNQAVGGSRTADNLNDDAAMAVSPEVLGVIRNVVTGNFGGALSTAIQAGRNGLTGNTAAVRQEVANILLQSGRHIPAGRMQDMVDQVLRRSLEIARKADAVTRGVANGTAVAGSNAVSTKR